MFEFVKQAPSGVPAGGYAAVFEGIEAVPPNAEKGYGSGYKFTWKVTTGEHAGRLASRIVSGDRPTAKNGLGRILDALAGRPLAEGERFNPTNCIGQMYTVIVMQSPNGGTRVETVAPVPTASAS